MTVRQSSDRSINLGICVDLRNPVSHRRDWTELYRDALDLCFEAEQWGISSVWLSEHHAFEDGYILSRCPLRRQSRLARASFNRIRTAVLLAPLWTPARPAEEAASADIISGGPLDLEPGAGYRRSEYELYGREFTARFATTDAMARELRRLWESDDVFPAARPGSTTDPDGRQRRPKGARRASFVGEGLPFGESGACGSVPRGLTAGGHPVDSARMRERLTF